MFCAVFQEPKAIVLDLWMFGFASDAASYLRIYSCSRIDWGWENDGNIFNRGN
jgi:hypothetical protein